MSFWLLLQLVGAKSAGRKSDVIRAVVGAADRFLGIKEISPEKLHEYMTEKHNLDSSQTSRSDSMEMQLEMMLWNNILMFYLLQWNAWSLIANAQQLKKIC